MIRYMAVGFFYLMMGSDMSGTVQPYIVSLTKKYIEYLFS
jgi:hypothetical protein